MYSVESCHLLEFFQSGDWSPVPIRSAEEQKEATVPGENIE